MKDPSKCYSYKMIIYDDVLFLDIYMGFRLLKKKASLYSFPYYLVFLRKKHRSG